MGSLALLQSLKESVLGQASVKAIYGEPISAHEKTIIPVAKIMYAYGAGAGTGGMGEKNTRGEGGGGGGGARRRPTFPRTGHSGQVHIRAPLPATR